MLADFSSRSARRSIRHSQRVTRLDLPGTSTVFQPVSAQIGHFGGAAVPESMGPLLKISPIARPKLWILSLANLTCSQDFHNCCTRKAALHRSSRFQRSRALVFLLNTNY